MTTNPMDYCPSEHEEDETNFEIPGEDDCDFTFSASDGDGTVTIRVQEHPYEPGIFYASVAVDSESASFVGDLETMAGPYDSPEDACRALSHHFDWFMNCPTGGEIEFCSDACKALGLETPNQPEPTPNQ